VVKVLTVGDVHLSDRQPSNCTESYNDDLFDLLDDVVKISGDRAVDAVVFAGDIFHIKTPSRTSHRTVQRMIDVVQSFACPVYGVIGNHDIQNDRLASVFETQPFGVLLYSGMKLLSGWADAPELGLYGVCWQQDWHNASDAFRDWREPSDAVAELLPKSRLIVTHAPLYPPGEELPWENVPAPTVASWMGGHNFCYYGHVHDLHGSFVSDGVTFCNQGSLSRGSLHESDFNRIPAVTIWHSDRTGVDAFERVELPSAKPGSEVFRAEEHFAKVAYQVDLDAFLGAVANSTVQTTSVESVIEHVRSLGLPEAELRLATEVLSAAASGELS
jgi:predicted phosphodiesterase